MSDIQGILKLLSTDNKKHFWNPVFSRSQLSTRPSFATIQELLAKEYSHQAISRQKKKKCPQPQSATDIQQIISSLASSEKATIKTPAKPTAYQPLDDLPGIEQVLLQQKFAGFPGAAAIRIAGNAPSQGSLNTLLKTQATGKAGGMVITGSQEPYLVNQPADIPLNNGSTGTASSGLNKKRVFLSIAAAAIIFLGVLVFRFGLISPEAHKTDSFVAQYALEMANGLKRYREAYGFLPGKLSQFPEFPANAIEWDIQQYGVKLTTIKQEFFYIEMPRGFVVISRFNDEAWLYSEEDDSLKKVAAH